MKVRRPKRNESGQAIIEFILVFVLLLMMIFAVIQVAWGIAFGHYVHYATYMSARSYMAAGDSKLDQTERARDVLNVMLKRQGGGDLFPFLAKARTGDNRDIPGGVEEVPGAFIGLHPTAEGQEGSRFFSWAEGVQYNFEVPLYLLPIAGFIKRDEGKMIQVGSGQDELKPVEWRGGIPFTSDAWLGREVSHSECFEEMTRLSQTAIRRDDGNEFIEDNGC